jgi:hypothetical protein
MKNQIASEIFHYTTSRWDWQDGKVNQMWIEEVTNGEGSYKYVAVAHNPEKNESMVMTDVRSYYDTLLWVRKFCGSFSILCY